jgi:hypothetical protein
MDISEMMTSEVSEIRYVHFRYPVFLSYHPFTRPQNIFLLCLGRSWIQIYREFTLEHNLLIYVWILTASVGSH